MGTFVIKYLWGWEYDSIFVFIWLALKGLFWGSETLVMKKLILDVVSLLLVWCTADASPSFPVV